MCWGALAVFDRAAAACFVRAVRDAGSAKQPRGCGLRQHAPVPVLCWLLLGSQLLSASRSACARHMSATTCRAMELTWKMTTETSDSGLSCCLGSSRQMCTQVAQYVRHQSGQRVVSKKQRGRRVANLGGIELGLLWLAASTCPTGSSTSAGAMRPFCGCVEPAAMPPGPLMPAISRCNVDADGGRVGEPGGGCSSCVPSQQSMLSNQPQKAGWCFIACNQRD